jgi:sensor histidine kinase regulating citrate/malate metabolism
MNDLYDRLSAVQHDLKNHFFAISGYLKIGDYRAAEEYADSVSSLDIFFFLAMYSTHPILNALIGARRAAADEGDIEFIIDIEMPGELPISDVELCILFGNLIDNAFEANESAFEPRYISISAKTVGGYWAVACRNGTREKAKICSTGSLKSTKKEQGPHGIGTKQIHKIADATGGYVAYNQENYEFTALVMLKLSEEEEDSFEKKDA